MRPYYFLAMERRGQIEVQQAMLTRGELLITQERRKLAAVTGSNIVCIFWHERTATTGIVNFSKPSTTNSKNTTLHYGNVAILTLAKKLAEKGATPEDCEVHIIGGACRERARTGEENYCIAQKSIAHVGATVHSQECGGTVGRKVLFDTESGTIAVLTVQDLRASDWY